MEGLVDLLGEVLGGLDDDGQGKSCPWVGELRERGVVGGNWGERIWRGVWVVMLGVDEMGEWMSGLMKGIRVRVRSEGEE